MALIHPSVGCPFTFSEKYLSTVSWPNVIEFYGKHHQLEGKDTLGFWVDWIGTPVAMDDGNIQLP